MNPTASLRSARVALPGPGRGRWGAVGRPGPLVCFLHSFARQRNHAPQPRTTLSSRLQRGTEAICAVILIAGFSPTAAADAPEPNRTPLFPSVTARTTILAPARPPGVPDDTAIEAGGARINEIRFNALQLFDVGGRDQDTALFRLANRLHIRTRESTIADQLLFQKGALFNASSVAESARILRTAHYLRDASIRPFAYRDGLVDLEVTTQDVWTLNPGISFGRRGGKNTAGVELEDLNFLGLGTQLGAGFKSGIDRDSTRVFYRDPQLGSSWWELSVAYEDNSDGQLGEFSLEQPFYSLDTRRAGGFSFKDDLRIDSRYDLGEVIDRFETRVRTATAYWGFSKGLSGNWALRYSLGLTYDEHEFANAPDSALATLLPPNRRLAYPWLAAEWVQDRFGITQNRDRIERTEDYSLGWKLRSQIGFASSATGADRTAVMLEGTVEKGYEFTTRQSFFLSATADGRFEDGALVNGSLGVDARYYYRHSRRQTFFMGFTALSGTRLDADRQVLLGGDNGLRGYPLRYQAGSGRWSFTAEHRIFTNWYPFQLVNVGGAAFFDIGQVTGRDPLGSKPRGLLKDVGFGLRLGNSRSAMGSVIHIDFAFPLNSDSSINALQIVVETKRSF